MKKREENTHLYSKLTYNKSLGVGELIFVERFHEFSSLSYL